MIHLICEEKVIVQLVSLVKLLNILVSAIGHSSVVTTTTKTTMTMMMVVVIVMMMIKIMVTMMGRNDAIKCKLSDRVLRPAQGLEHNIWWRNEYKYKYNQSTNTSTNTVWSCLMHVLWCLVVSMYIYIG